MSEEKIKIPFWKQKSFLTSVIPIIAGGSLVVISEWCLTQLEPNRESRLKKVEVRLEKDSQWYKPVTKAKLTADSGNIMIIFGRLEKAEEELKRIHTQLNTQH